MGRGIIFHPKASNQDDHSKHLAADTQLAPGQTHSYSIGKAIQWPHLRQDQLKITQHDTGIK